MARTKTEEKHLTDGPKSPKKKNSVRYLFYFVEKNCNKKSLEGKFQNKIQIAVSGTESTIESDTGKIINRKFISGPLFQTERKSRKEPALKTTGEMNAKKPTLPTRTGREVRPMGWNPPGHPKRQTKNRTKQKAGKKRYRRRWRRWRNAGRNRNTNHIRHFRERRKICANTDKSGRGCTTTTYRQRNNGWELKNTKKTNWPRKHKTE